VRVRLRLGLAAPRAVLLVGGEEVAVKISGDHNVRNDRVEDPQPAAKDTLGWFYVVHVDVVGGKEVFRVLQVGRELHLAPHTLVRS